jgi:antitoxin MazE
MHITIREIGNSRGIIIPATALKEAGIGEMADLQIEKDRLILTPLHPSCAQWLEAIRQDPPDTGEPVFMDGIEDPELVAEWKW